ncbi:HNH endonuclease, partial [Sinorhizobium meliloti]
MSSRRDRIRAKIMARVWIDPVTGCYVWTGPDSGKN